jgi:hypothetical protein
MKKLLVLATILTLAAGAFCQTIVISSGGTYSPQNGNLPSTITNGKSNVPAISVQTTAYVVIENVTIYSSTDAIDVVAGANLNVNSCYIYSFNSNVYGQQPGNGIYCAGTPASFTANNNYFQGWTEGIWLNGDPNSGATTVGIYIYRNRFANENGCFSNGNGGWVSTLFKNTSGEWSDAGGGYGPLDPNPPTPPNPPGFYIGAHAIIVMHVHSDPNVNIGENDVIDPIESSDVIDIYGCSGVSASQPIVIQYNHLEGPLPADYWVKNEYGHGITMDNSPAPAADTNRYVSINNNYLDRGADIALWAGDHLTATHNDIVFSGLDASGNTFVFWTFGIWLVYNQTPHQETNSASYNSIQIEDGSNDVVDQKKSLGRSTNETFTTNQTEADVYADWQAVVGTNVGPQ